MSHRSESTGAQLLAAALASEGVSTVFGLPGVQLDPVMNAFHARRDEIDFIAVRHEQSATYAADGYARASGRPGVAVVVPGPGVLNAGAGLATGYACSSPMLLVSGAIDSRMVGRGLGALHEIDRQSELLASLTKWSAFARNADEIPDLVHEAFFQMRSDRPRPVAIEVPPDVLRQTTTATAGESWAPAPTAPDARAIAEALRALAQARRPFVIAGGGVIAADAGAAVLELAEALQVPVVLSRNGRGAVDARHPLVFDPLAQRDLVRSADLVIAIGTRLGSSDGGHSDLGDASVVTVNVDPAAFRFPRPRGVRVRADARLAVEALVRGIRSAPEQFGPAQWGEELAEVREHMSREFEAIAPQVEYLDAIREAMPDDSVFVSEYTQIGYAASIRYPVHRPRGFISPGYQGTLGYGFATALGAQVGAGDSPVVSVNGDGGFSWTLSDLSTAKKYGIPLTAIVFNDGYYFNVRRMQRDEWRSDYIATDLDNPDYVALAAAFGIEGHRVVGPDALRERLRASVASGRPSLIEVPVSEFPSPWGLIDAL